MSDSEWSVELARELYGLNNYMRQEFIDVDDEGFLVVKVNGYRARLLDLMKKYGLSNAYVRVLPAIRWAMDQVVRAYLEASEEAQYRGRLIPVYPLKVDANPVVVETIWRHGRRYNWGFEVGTLQELKSIEKYLSEGTGVLVVDGFKTSEELEALKKHAERGWRVILTIESEREAELAGRFLDSIEVGVRLKPMTRTGSKWSFTMGFTSKFGMTLNRLMMMVKDFPFLKKALTTIHVHGGSQITDIKAVARLAHEAVSILEDLRELGFENLNVIDLGGGLAYPYLDLRDGSHESPNYTIRDYFKAVLSAFRKSKRHPDLVFENGRIITSAHRIVVAKVLETREYGPEEYEESLDLDFIERAKDMKELERSLVEFREVLAKMEGKEEWGIRAKHIIETTRARMINSVVSKVMRMVLDGPLELSEVLKYPTLFKIVTSPSKRFIVSYSLFADIPDKTIVNQYFQVVPLTRLNEKPHVLASLSDLTCDSMGEYREYYSYVSRVYDKRQAFTGMDGRLMAVPGVKVKLGGIPLHLPSSGEDYYIAFLDTGAYQDMLAMKHNLIGEPPEIIIDESSEGELRVECLKCESKGYTDMKTAGQA
ncbi:decarboxylase [Thermogladius sp.]|uniref:decarboxylase n=1 Tax=Thermogladius sp. TaxID=2023064 RepID=UPI003D10E027